MWTVPFLPIVVKVYSGCETFLSLTRLPFFLIMIIMWQFGGPCDYPGTVKPGRMVGYRGSSAASVGGP